MDGGARPERKGVARADDFVILFQNEELMVINKPCDVAMDGADREDITVDSWVRTCHKPFLSRPLPSGVLVPHSSGSAGTLEKQLKFVHQLDYATSGVLCLAFSRDMAARLAHCFECRLTLKQYVAVIEGVPPLSWFTGERLSSELPRDPLLQEWGSLRVDSPIGDDCDDQQKFRMKVDPVNGKAAKTLVQLLRIGVLRDQPGFPVTEVLLQPETGRRHQLRVHLASIGFPIVGDATYGTSSAIAPRMMLHAWKLILPEDVRDGQSHDARIAARKKRRRECLGLEQGQKALTDDPSAFTVVTENPFASFVVPSLPSAANDDDDGVAQHDQVRRSSMSGS